MNLSETFKINVNMDFAYTGFFLTHIFWRPKSKIGVLNYGHFSDFFWDGMTNLSLINFKLGSYIKVNVKNGKH